MRITHFLLPVLLLTITVVAFGQPDEYVNDAFERNVDYVYKDNIKGVRLLVNNDPRAYPILTGGDQLLLTFDDLDFDIKDYAYTLIHCDADWTPSNLNPLEYIDGYTVDEIITYEYSFNTLVDYTNYQLQLPNNNLSWTKSGNYLLKVFLDEGEEELVLTRRFVVVDQQMNISAELVRPFSIDKFKTHHEIDFVVNHEGITVRAPQTEIKVAILQNGRWDNAKTDIKPLFIRGDNLIFDYQDKIVFQAGREFRRFDARSNRFRADRIRSIEDLSGGTALGVFPDEPRSGKMDADFADINGRYFYGNLHENDPLLQSDYVNVFFELKYPFPIDFGNLYLFGEFSDWQLKEEFKLKYNEDYQSYIGELYLKQGYYNYSYAFVEDGSYTIDFDLIEGNWWEVENDYHILVYYRPFGERYDRLVAVTALNSNPIREQNRLRNLGLERVLRR